MATSSISMGSVDSHSTKTSGTLRSPNALSNSFATSAAADIGVRKHFAWTTSSGLQPSQSSVFFRLAMVFAAASAGVAAFSAWPEM